MKGFGGRGPELDLTYLVPYSFLTETDQLIASEILSSMPNGGVVSADQVPEWWAGLELFRSTPFRPISIVPR